MGTNGFFLRFNVSFLFRCTNLFFHVVKRLLGGAVFTRITSFFTPFFFFLGRTDAKKQPGVLSDAFNKAEVLQGSKQTRPQLCR